MLTQLDVTKIHFNAAELISTDDSLQLVVSAPPLKRVEPEKPALEKTTPILLLVPALELVEAKVQINARGLEILRRFERLPSYAEQSIREIERAVLRVVTVGLTSNQFSALVSLTYSLGEANLRRSLLLRHLNARRYEAAAKEFDRWVYVGLERIPELVARRRAEKRLFLRIKP